MWCELLALWTFLQLTSCSSTGGAFVYRGMVAAQILVVSVHPWYPGWASQTHRTHCEEERRGRSSVAGLMTCYKTYPGSRRRVATGGQAGLKYSTCLLLVNQSSPKKSRTYLPHTHTLKSYGFLLLNTSIHQLLVACLEGRVLGEVYCYC